MKQNKTQIGYEGVRKVKNAKECKFRDTLNPHSLAVFKPEFYKFIAIFVRLLLFYKKKKKKKYLAALKSDFLGTPSWLIFTSSLTLRAWGQFIENVTA